MSGTVIDLDARRVERMAPEPQPMRLTTASALRSLLAGLDDATPVFLMVADEPRLRGVQSVFVEGFIITPEGGQSREFDGVIIQATP